MSYNIVQAQQTGLAGCMRDVRAERRNPAQMAGGSAARPAIEACCALYGPASLELQARETAVLR